MFQSPYITLIFLWIIFGIVHRGLSSGIVTRAATRLMGKAAKYYRAVYSLFVLIALLFLIHYHFAAIDTILFRPHWIEKIIAGILIIGSVVIMVVYVWSYIISFSGVGVVLGMEGKNELQQTGLYAYSRHPMFAGAILFVWGVFLGYPYMNNLVSAGCVTVYAFINIYVVEKRLRLTYGDPYKVYGENVPLLFPKISK
ncbi:MAG: NnrU family protein [Sediminibacterium sp.]